MINKQNLQLLIVSEHFHKRIPFNHSNVHLVDLAQNFIHLHGSHPIPLHHFPHLQHNRAHFIVISLIVCLTPLLFFVTFHSAQRLDRVVHQPDCLVDIWLLHLRSEVKLGHCLCQPNKPKQSSRRHVQIARVSVDAIPLNFAFFNVFAYDVVMKQVRNHRIKGLCVGDEGTHHLSWYGFSIVFCV